MENEQQNTITEQPQTTSSEISIYCERNSKPDFMAEPLNLITNIAFVIGAIMVFKMLKFYKLISAKNWDIILLTAILATIGFGSGSFHSMPSTLTQTLDVIPIEAFIFIYLAVFFVRVIGVKPIFTVFILGAFLGVTILFGKNFSASTLNGTIMYVPTYLMLIVMVLIMGFVKQNPLYLHLINTAVIWTFSLAFRTMDMQICSYTHNIGTHFMWHILNAVVLYRMLVLVVMDKLAKQNMPA